jgi:hypothetical protein
MPADLEVVPRAVRLLVIGGIVLFVGTFVLLVPIGVRGA